MYGNSFLSRILGRGTDEDETRIDAVEDFETRRSRKRSEPEEERQPWDYAVNLAVETIGDLPPNFPRDNAVRIVRRTLSAADIEIGYFNKCTWTRVSQISSEMELARRRIKEFQEKTEETIRSLEREIRKAREAYEAVLAKEEEEISRATKELENIKRLRAFFGFSETDGEEDTNPSGKEILVPGPLYEDSAQQGRGFFSSLMEGEENFGPGGEVTQVRDSLAAAWAQIEATRAQMRERFDTDAAGAVGSTHGPVEGSPTYSKPNGIRG
ncbi:MAG: hypothetical protein QOI57_1914 [Rubrobacteraceae bacterium]|jgi:hypothetical protein|nr:hypothetical protein [Rubrobacteraceae bacterium]